MAGERIFIVEDDRTLLPMFQDLVRNLGYTVAGSASTGEDAIASVVKVRPDLVLMDIRIGGNIDGIQAADEIRARLAIPILYMTAYDEQQLLERAKGTEPYAYLLKPINPRELRVALELAIYRNRTEASLRRLNDAIAKINTDLEVAYREMEAFSYSAAHDLQSPLRKIESWAGMLQSRLEGKLDGGSSELLRKILDASGRIDRIVGDLLRFSKASLAPIQRSPVDVSALAKEVATDLKEADPGRKVEVEVAPGLRADGDPALMRLLLENLIGNAWKFTRPRAKARIEVGAETSEAGSAFFVKDDGVGFEPAYANNLFTPFHRLHTEAEFPGTGVGLALCQRIVRRHGGRIWAEGAKDKGAVFRFTLS